MTAIFGVLALSLAVGINSVSAAVTGTPASSKAKTTTAAKGAIKGCAVIGSKIQAKVTSFDNTKLKHLSVYANLKDRLSKLADRLTARGADVSALRADLLALDQKIAKFSADYAAYMSRFKVGQDAVCGKPEATFKIKLKEAKTALQLVHKDAADIRAFVNTTIKSDINKIRAGFKANATTTATTTAVAATTTPAKPAPAKAKVKPIAPALPSLD